MIWLIVTLGVVVTLLGLLLLKEGVHLSVYGTNLSYTVDYQIRLLGGVIRIPKDRLIQKEIKKEEEKGILDLEEQTFTMQKIHQLLEDAIVVFRAAAPVVQQELIFEHLEFQISAGFSDPAVNGIAFGALASTVGTLQSVMQYAFVIKKCRMQALPDFVSEEGIKIIFDTTLYIRPMCFLVKCLNVWFRNPDIRKLVKRYTKKDERE